MSVTMSDQDFNKLEARAKKAGEIAKKGAEWSFLQFGKHKSAITALLVGSVGWYVISNKAWSDNWSWLKKTWWAKSAIVLGLGALAYYYKKAYSTTILMAGAALFVTAWKNKKWAENPANEAALEALEKSGFADTGSAIDSAGDYVAGGSGGSVVRRGGTDEAERFANRVFGNARAS